MTKNTNQRLRYKLRDVFIDYIMKTIVVAGVAPATGVVLSWIWKRIARAQWPDLPVTLRPWFIFTLVYTLTTITISLTAWLWESRLVLRFHESYRDNGRRLLGKLLLSLLIPIPFAATAALLISPAQIHDTEGEELFPQASDLGPVFIRTFATNGQTEYQFVHDAQFGGPNGYAKITLTAYGSTAEQSAGWVFYFIRGSDISDQRQLRFFIRGKDGSEKIGVKMKDARGVEVAHMLNDESSLKEITANWQEASIRLSDFPNVDFQLMDSLTLFTDGSIAANKPQTIYVGGFRLLTSE